MKLTRIDRANVLAQVALVTGLLLCDSVLAQTRCQCSYTDWVGDCAAKLVPNSKWIKVISNTAQCSRVDWYVDGNPQVTIVTDGVEVQEWLGKSATPVLVVQSCKICKDSQLSSTSQAPQAGQGPQPDAGQPITSAFVGTWTGTTTNDKGIARSITFQIRKVSGKSFAFDATFDGEYWGTATGTVDGDTFVYKLNSCVGKLTLVDQQHITESCKYLNTYDNGSLSKSN
jgi:hypothetical protein